MKDSPRVMIRVTNFLQGYADAGFNKYKDFGLDTQLVLEDLTF